MRVLWKTIAGHKANVCVMAGLVGVAALSGCADYNGGDPNACQVASGEYQAITGQSDIARRSLEAATGLHCAALQQR